MSMKIYRPTSPGRRGMTGLDYSEIAKKRPEKALTRGKRRRGGRNSAGRITSRFRGGGHRRKLREIEFGQRKQGVPGVVEAIEYDPNRTAFLALIRYRDGDRRYILAPQGLAAGTPVLIDERTPLKSGNRAMLKYIPVGIEIHNVELFPGKGGQLVRSAGSAARIVAHEGGYAHVELPSSEVRRIPETAFASLGIVSNAEWISLTEGKAGRSRWRGRRPHVRGSAMNPVDHPHGGGEGRAPIGLKYPKTPWGKPALGVKTRKRKKSSGIFIVRRRQHKRRA
ncbi:MAG: 50S ribosomal protein L2 [Candidatus Terrybacteria bacterium]|nr:50S ribosomal protein L2 [Candidatus Terrybacteria bacterium]